MTLEMIGDVVSNALRAHLAPASVKILLVYEEVDAEGDPILRLRVVMDSDGPAVAAEKVFTATGVVRGALEEIGETRFPLLSYPTSDELPGVAA